MSTNSHATVRSPLSPHTAPPPSADASLPHSARTGNASLLRLQLEQDPDLVTKLDSDSRTPLQCAISALPPSVHAAEACLDALARLDDARAKANALENGDGVGNTALISAGASPFPPLESSSPAG